MSPTVRSTDTNTPPLTSSNHSSQTQTTSTMPPARDSTKLIFITDQGST